MIHFCQVEIVYNIREGIYKICSEGVAFFSAEPKDALGIMQEYDLIPEDAVMLLYIRYLKAHGYLDILE